MEINMSYESATRCADDIKVCNESILDGELEDATIVETNFNSGRGIYDRMKTMSLDYMSVVARDENNVRNIADGLLDIDEKIFSNNA